MTPRPSRGEPAALTSRPAPPRAAALQRVHGLLADPGLAWVVQRVRGQLETGADPVAVLQLHSATAAQRAGARAVLGPAALVRGTHLSVRVTDLEELLAEVAGWEGGLAAAVTALDGEDGDDAAVVLPPTPPAAVAGPPAPAPRAAAAPAPRAAAAPAPRAAAAPAPRPAPGPDPAPAARPAQASAPHPAPAPAPPPAPRWAELDDDAADEAGAALADVVLALDLPAAPDGPTGAALAALAAAGLPALLSLAQLRSAPPTWLPAPPGGTALVCPTPAVLAAVAAAPPAARRTRVPVVCLDAAAASAAADPAWPGEAVAVVLEGLRAAGWRLLLDAGWGPEGEVLTELLSGELHAEPWSAPDHPGTTPLARRVAAARRLQG
ncbi:hypothetical protein [Quadrisphaera sp. KR29]|uniref:hypothetical protein n=1 Tax=Quadrisphaera sp. KR29 TaxID=3461391 RepID=UPI00404463BF